MDFPTVSTFVITGYQIHIRTRYLPHIPFRLNVTALEFLLEFLLVLMNIFWTRSVKTGFPLPPERGLVGGK